MKRYYLALTIIAAILIGFVNPVAAGMRLYRDPGTYRDWGDIDEVTIVRSFQFLSYRQVAVAPLDGTGNSRRAQAPRSPNGHRTHLMVKGR